MSSKRHPQVVNVDEVTSREVSRGGFGHQARRLGAEAGGRGLGCSHYEIPPGKAAFPYHFHTHALSNAGPGPLRYLCMSGAATPTTLDIVGYPDSKKIAFASGVDPVKGFRGGAWLMKLIKEDQPAADYYDDEPLAKAGG